jgi:hypothetical protein
MCPKILETLIPLHGVLNAYSLFLLSICQKPFAQEPIADFEVQSSHLSFEFHKLSRVRDQGPSAGHPIRMALAFFVNGDLLQHGIDCFFLANQSDAVFEGKTECVGLVYMLMQLKCYFSWPQQDGDVVSKHL